MVSPLLFSSIRGGAKLHFGVNEIHFWEYSVTMVLDFVIFAWPLGGLVERPFLVSWSLPLTGSLNDFLPGPGRYTRLDASSPD